MNSATERAMQQAYIANQMQNRNLGQQLAAMDRSGGASESTMLGTANEYGNARGELDLSRNDQLATLAAQLAEGRQATLTHTTRQRRPMTRTIRTGLQTLPRRAWTVC